MSDVKKSVLFISVCLIMSLALPLSANVAGLETTVVQECDPANWILPWPSGISAIVTWEPEDHWENDKASGLAFDFSLPEGTPLFAPASGQATFLRDDRSLETTLGNYIDLTVGDEWVIRLAHLRDEQTGSVFVEQGQLIGYVGHSGVALTHLHFEILAVQGDQLVCPQRTDIPWLMEQALTNYATDAVIPNETPGIGLYCDSFTCATTEKALGQYLQAELSIKNTTAYDTEITKLYVDLVSPTGIHHSRTIFCNKFIPANGEAAMPLTLMPDEVGYWTIAEVTAVTSQGSIDMPIMEGFAIGESPITFVGISNLSTCSLGEELTAQIWLYNQTSETIELDQVLLSGVSPSNTAWIAKTETSLTLEFGQLVPATVVIQSATRAAGDWIITRIGFVKEGNEFTLARIEQNLHVTGPSIKIQQVSVCPSLEGLKVYLLVQNMGDKPASLSRLNMWALDAEGTSYFPVNSEPVGLLDPGEQRLVEADVWEGEEGLTLVQGGYWASGAFWPVSLPTSLAKSNQWDL